MSEPCLRDRILEPGSLSVCFEPVLELRAGRPVPHYHEALIRGPRGTTVENPTILFDRPDVEQFGTRSSTCP